MTISPESLELLKALQRLGDPEDPATRELESGGYLTINPDGIEVSPKGEALLCEPKKPTHGTRRRVQTPDCNCEYCKAGLGKAVCKSPNRRDRS